MCCKKLKFFCAAIFSISCTALAQESGDLNGAVMQVFSSYNGGTSMGAGFLLADGQTLVTAYHVVQGASKVVFQSTRGFIVNPKIKSYDAESDLITFDAGQAFLAVNGLSTFEASIFKSESGFIIGHPDTKANFKVPFSLPTKKAIAAREWVWKDERSDGYKPIFKNPDLPVIPINGVINRGMSGGPVILEGQVIGIVSGSEEVSGGGFGWAIPILKIHSLSLNTQNLRPDQLPKVAILNSTATLKPLRVTETGQANEFFEYALQYQRHASAFRNFFARAKEHSSKLCNSETQSSDQIKKCLEFLNSASTILGELMNSTVTVTTNTNDEIARKLPAIFARVTDPIMVGKSIFRNIEDSTRCLFNKSALPDIRKLANNWTARVQVISKKSDEAARGLFEANPANSLDAQEYFRRAADKDILVNLQAAFFSDQLFELIEAIATFSDRGSYCLKDLSAAIDSQNTRIAGSRTRNLVWDEMRENEKAAMSGYFYSSIILNDEQEDLCHQAGFSVVQTQSSNEEVKVKLKLKSFGGALLENSDIEMMRRLARQTLRSLIENDAKYFCSSSVGAPVQKRVLDVIMDRAALSDSSTPSIDKMKEEIGLALGRRIMSMVNENNAEKKILREINSLIRSVYSAQDIFFYYFIKNEIDFCEDLNPKAENKIKSARLRVSEESPGEASEMLSKRLGIEKGEAQRFFEILSIEMSKARVAQFQTRALARDYCENLVAEINAGQIKALSSKFSPNPPSR